MGTQLVKPSPIPTAAGFALVRRVITENMKTRLAQRHSILVKPSGYTSSASRSIEPTDNYTLTAYI